ncbi:MAG TPA: PA domain-containing protein [Thermoanaerobaculia bacterium]
MRRFLPLLLLLLTSANLYAAKVTIINTDGPNVGFNDPTPASPVAGNPGTTRGAQRLYVIQTAANIWGARLYSNVEITIATRFAPIAGECDATSAVLAFAGSQAYLANFANAPLQNVRYPIALANKFAGTDLRPNDADIVAQFNADVDNDTCLGESNWYYGLDGNEGDHQDLLATALHEFAHGLGMAGSANLDTGALTSNLPSVYTVNVFDNETNLFWHQMTNAQRVASATNTGNVVWAGAFARASALRLLQPLPVLTTSGLISRGFDIGTADFGADVQKTTASGTVVPAIDAVTENGPTTTDGCSTYTNTDAVRGKWALVDRGTCQFVVKGFNAQQAGAVGLIVVDNRRDTCYPPAMGIADPEVDPALVTIPVISVSQDDGAVLRANAGAQALLHVDPTRLAGADAQGRPRLYAPCTLESGSSIHHWDITATPNLLMEPSISHDLDHNLDISTQQLYDIGWGLQPTTGRRVTRR